MNNSILLLVIYNLKKKKHQLWPTTTIKMKNAIKNYLKIIYQFHYKENMLAGPQGFMEQRLNTTCLDQNYFTKP